MYKKSLLSICLVFSMLCSIPVHAQEENSINNHTINSAKSYTETTHEEAQPMLVDETATDETSVKKEIEPLDSTATKDPYESNDTKETAYPYSMIPTRSTAISSSSDLFWLGMKEGGLHNSN